jgi:hypothetical protein
LADVVTGNALISGGVGSDPAWGKIGLQTHVDGTLQVTNGGTGATTLTGYVYGNGTGAFTASTSIPNSATTATSANTASAIVARDGSGNFSAGTITASLNGNASTATTAANVNNGTLTMAVSGTGLSGSATFTANQSGNSTFTVTSNATNANTGSTIVARDASGNFSAGTITATLSGNASTATTATTATTASDSSLLNGISAVNLYNNMGQPHSTRTSFDATTPSYGFGYRFVQGNTNGPGTGGSQYYSWYIGLGSDYPATGSGSYGAMFAVDRNSTAPYLSVRYNEGNSFSAWQRIRAGYADSAGALTTGNNYQVNSLGVGTAASGTAGEIRATNNVTAYFSDDRLKTRLGPIENALAKVLALEGFYYEANELAQSLGYEPIREVGLSAQQTQKVLPEVVVPAPIDDKYLTMRYERVIPLLVEAIKELSAEVNRLKEAK